MVFLLIRNGQLFEFSLLFLHLGPPFFLHLRQLFVKYSSSYGLLQSLRVFLNMVVVFLADVVFLVEQFVGNLDENSLQFVRF